MEANGNQPLQDTPALAAPAPVDNSAAQAALIERARALGLGSLMGLYTTALRTGTSESASTMRMRLEKKLQQFGFNLVDQGMLMEGLSSNAFSKKYLPGVAPAPGTKIYGAVNGLNAPKVDTFDTLYTELRQSAVSPIERKGIARDDRLVSMGNMSLAQYLEGDPVLRRAVSYYNANSNNSNPKTAGNQEIAEFGEAKRAQFRLAMRQRLKDLGAHEVEVNTMMRNIESAAQGNNNISQHENARSKPGGGRRA